jgi:dolichol-phosphate mannosyltransferase
VWVVLPTYNERENVEGMAAAILDAVPQARLLIVDDASPDGTGALADALAERDERVSVLHRPGKQGLGVAYRDIPGGGTVGWPLHRRLISRAGTLFARTVLLLPYRDLTGGFKAWRRELLESIRLREASASGYGFQVETTWWAHRRGARIVQVPIVFRERVAGRSKMTGSIVREALLLVVRLRISAMLGRAPRER